MPIQLERIEGRKFCVVFVKVLDPIKERVQLSCLRGRASVDRGRVSIIDEAGSSFTVPGTAIPNIMPNDGTRLLRDAEYFCFVKVDPNISLSGQDQAIIDVDEASASEEDDCDCHSHTCHCHSHPNGECHS